MVLGCPILDRPVLHRALRGDYRRRIGGIEHDWRRSFNGDEEIRRAARVAGIGDHLGEIQLAAGIYPGGSKTFEALDARRRVDGRRNTVRVIVTILTERLSDRLTDRLDRGQRALRVIIA